MTDTNKTNVVVTGGLGFVGSHLIEHILKNTDWNICVIDKMTYASMGYDRIRDMDRWHEFEGRVRFFATDIQKDVPVGVEKEIGRVDYIFHLAAETHVDKSIENPELFVMSNVMGTTKMLQYARRHPELKKFYLMNTDEVYGPAPVGVNYKEWDRLHANNPYAAAKAGALQMALAFQNTYKVPVIVGTVMNIFGERQHPEKFIPMTIKKVLAGETVTIHADRTRTKSGTRYYIHARNVASAILWLLEHGTVGELYNVVGEREVSNLELAQFIADYIGKPLNYEMVDFHSSRPGHDLRYALDGERLKTMGYEYPRTFEQSMEKTIQWYLDHKDWLAE